MFKNIYVSLFVLLTQSAFAQDPIVSQYYQAPLFLNPGFTGLTQQQRIVLNNRIQWPSLPQGFTTYLFSYDIRLDDLNSGFGILVTNDKIGSVGWQTTTVGLFYSYTLKLNDKLILSPGISFGYGINGLDRTKLILGDELEYNGHSLDPALNRLGNDQFVDFGAGLVLYSKIWWLGASFSHMNQPNLSIVNNVTKLQMRTNITVGARFALRDSRNSLKSGAPSYLTPSVIYQTQGVISQLTAGASYHVDPVFIGFYYRGKPFEINSLGTLNQDAVIFQLGLLFKNITISYSYDFNISPLSSLSGGAHEISLIYVFEARLAKKIVKKKQKLIPCPTGIHKTGFWK